MGYTVERLRVEADRGRDMEMQISKPLGYCRKCGEVSEGHTEPSAARRDSLQGYRRRKPQSTLS
jgi:hypothetical protein